MVLGLGGFRRAGCRGFIILLIIGLIEKFAPNIKKLKRKYWCAEMLNNATFVIGGRAI
jgi:hypothetical protein